MIYLDNAATTQVLPEVFEVMKPYLQERYGNPSSLYPLGEQSSNAITEAKQTIADTLNCSTDEIHFTAGATEANNWVIKSVAEMQKDVGNHIITSKIEHHSVLNTCKYLETKGYEVTYLDVDENGVVSLKQLKEAIKPTTILVSIMYVNNETGVVQPIEEIADIIYGYNGYNALFHVDATQAYTHMQIDPNRLKIDYMSVSGHKFHASKGVGFLFTSQQFAPKLTPLLHGGSQESGLRAGTENVASIVGMAKAAEIACNEMVEVENHKHALINRVIDTLTERGIDFTVNGDGKGTCNITLHGVDATVLSYVLFTQDVCVSTGSACAKGVRSHVLKAMGLSDEAIDSSIRISVSKLNTEEEIETFCYKLLAAIYLLKE